MKSISKFSMVGAVLLTGCASAERELLLPDQADVPGVVISELVVSDSVSAMNPERGDSDCFEGSGLGVMTRSTTGDTRFLFDQNGKPCDPAVTMFDGTAAVHQRAADPGVNIAFIDPHHMESPPAPPSDSSIMLLGDATLPEEFAATGELVSPKAATDHVESLSEDQFSKRIAARQQADLLNKEAFDYSYQQAAADAASATAGEDLAGTVADWKAAHNHQKLVRSAEKLIAGARGLERKSAQELVIEHQEEITRLLMRLREAERMNAVQRERERQLEEQLTTAEAQLHANTKAQNHAQTVLENKVVAMEQRAREYQSLSRELTEDKNHTEQMLQRRIVDLRSQLSLAEQQADATQQQLLLDAAQQLAKAERAAKVARNAKRLELERKAEQRKNEAVYLAEKARQLEEGIQINLPTFADIASFESPEAKLEERLMVLENRLKALETPTVDGVIKPASFEETVISLNAKDLPLAQIMDNVMEQLRHSGGPWRVSWEISSAHRGVAAEKWTVVAEATFAEFLAYVKEKVQQVHGAALAFHRFDDNRLFVISDTNTPY